MWYPTKKPLRWGTSLWLSFLTLSWGSLAQADNEWAAVILVTGEDGAGLLTEAEEIGGARWRLERIDPTDERAPVPPPEVEAMRQAYFEADFLACLSPIASGTIDIESLIMDGPRDAAVSVIVFGAACAHGSGEVQRARQLLFRSASAELDVDHTILQTAPNFQAFAEAVLREARTAQRVSLRIESTPAATRVIVDGETRACPATPCDIRLIPGEHGVELGRLGYRSLQIRVGITSDRTINVLLEEADPEATRLSIRHALAGSMSLGDPALLEAAALAFEARVVAAVWEEDGSSRGALYDRALARVVGRTTSSSADSRVMALRQILLEWQGEVGPPPLRRNPLFWTLTGVGAAAVAVSVFFLFRNTQQDAVLFPRD